MRVLLLGAAGWEGREMAKGLAQSQDISHIIAADIRADRVQRIASDIGAKVSAQVVDVNDKQHLVSLMKEVDLVANCVGPYYRYMIPVLEAVMEAKVNYIDIADSADPTLDAIERYDEVAKSAGITVLLGMGDGPGLDNVLCRYAIDRLDKVEKIHVYWCTHWGAGGGGYAAALQGYFMYKGISRQILDGREVEVPAGTGAEIVEFPDGVLECRYCREPEPITLSRYAQRRGKGPVKEAYNKGGVAPQLMIDNQLKLKELGFDDEEPIHIKGDTSVAPLDVAIRVMSKYASSVDLGEPWAGWKNEVIGEKEGKKVSYITTPAKSSEVLTKPMEALTAHCAVVAAIMFARGEITEKGVLPPEECVDPTLFLPRLTKEVGMPIIETEIATGSKQIFP